MIANKNFCPFIKDTCRDDCTFKTVNTSMPHGKISDCLIAVKLSDINEMQHDDLVDIYNVIKKD